MQRPTLLSTLLLLLAPACASTSGSLNDFPSDEKVANEQFDTIKSLAGDWAGQEGDGDKATPVEVRYRLTAGGSAVEETLAPGTDHEMVTMYHLDHGRLMLTHYCSAGNQPRMVAEPSTPANPATRIIAFTFADATNLASPAEGHMHHLLMVVDGTDRLNTEWVYYKDGQPAEQARFRLRRKVASAS